MNDHRAKLEWARKHFEALNDEINAFLATEPYRLSAKHEPEEEAYVIRLQGVSDLPAEWSLRVGDTLHNMRSALDAIVFSLVAKNLKRQPTEAEAKRAQFVIVDDKDDWPYEAKKWLSLVSDDAKGTIYRFQPCHREDKSGRHGLSILRDLSNIDKHRHVLVTLGWLSDSHLVVSAPSLKVPITLPGHVGAIKNGTVIGQFVVAGPPGIVSPEAIKVDTKIFFDVTFEEKGPALGNSVMSFLASTHHFILEQVFPPLEALL